MERAWPSRPLRPSVPGRARTLFAACAAVAVACLVWGAGPARAASPQQVIDVLNAQREAHGIPAGLVEDPQLSRGCDLHNRYLALNPGAYPHSEIPGASGYTRAGAAIAPLSVFTRGGSFASGVNPFNDAPFHLETLLRPALRVTGASESYGWTCVVVRGARERRRGPGVRFYTYPGPGRASVAARQVVWREFPYAPGDLVGIPQGTASGPHLFMFAFGRTRAPLRIRSASVEGPMGRLALRVVDGTHPQALMLPPSAILVAPTPLMPGAYCATVRGSLAGIGRFTHRWPFVTEGSSASPSSACVPPPQAELRLVRLRRSGSRVRVLVGVHPGSRGRLTVGVDAGPGPRRLSRIGRSRRRGGTRVQAFAGALPTAPGGRWVVLEARYRRTDGGTDARTGKVLRARG